MPIQDDITLALIAINIILTIILVYIYAKNYKKISSRYTLGLLFFSVMFMAENVMNLYFYSSLIQQSITGITAFHLSVNFIEMIALALLLYVTWK
jgi:uncharacterized PurR-regulated membrane protein YhhQ (DUF165 family)